MKSDIQSEQSCWNKVLAELDRRERNNNRRHREYRDSMDTTINDRQKNEEDDCPSAKMLNFSNHSDWIDIIYSRKFEDLHQLVTDEGISDAIKNLTDCQKEVLFLNLVKQYTAQEIAKFKATSDRNIRKHRQKAIESIQKELDLLKDNNGEGTVYSVGNVLGIIIFWPFILGWKVANKIYPMSTAANTPTSISGG